MQPLLISAVTLASSLGVGLGPTMAAIREQRSGLRRCDFETVTLNTWIGPVDEAEQIRLPPALAAYDCRNNRLALLALQSDGFDEAVAALKARLGASRIGVFVGTSTSGILQTEIAYRQRDAQGRLPAGFDYAGTHNTFSVADFTRRRLGLGGPAVAVSAACASSAKVFGNAARMIDSGLIDAAVVGGVDSLCLTTLYGFNSLELISSDVCRPFDADRRGLSIGEAGGFAILERSSAGTDPEAILFAGIGESSDAHHMSAPHPQGAGARAAMEQALQSASLEPHHIDYINLHGTGTPSNDAAEDQAVSAVFGTMVPASSTKGATGHTLGAAGILEAIVAALAIRNGLAPGGINTNRPDPALRIRYLRSNHERRIDFALSNSFGFGGANCSMILGRAGALAAAARKARS